MAALDGVIPMLRETVIALEVLGRALVAVFVVVTVLRLIGV